MMKLNTYRAALQILMLIRIKNHNNTQRIVINGMVKDEGDAQVWNGVEPYPVAYPSITPKKTECTNLLVPVCISASHIAYGSIRM